MLAFITANVSTISLFFPAVLSDCFDFATSVLSNPRDYSRTESPSSAITAELTPASVQSLLESVSKRVQSVKKREAELEKEMKARLEASIAAMEEKDKEIIRQQQRGYEEEVSEEEKRLRRSLRACESRSAR